MSSSDLPSLDREIMFMTADPRGARVGWLFFHGRGEAWYINERDLIRHAASNAETIVWYRPGGEIAGKINADSAKVLARLCIGRRTASFEDDHGLSQPLSGGTDVMQKLQNRLRVEQGLSTRPENNRLANTKDFDMSDLLPVEIAQLRAARFEEGDTAGWEKWMKTQPQSVQDDWQANKEKYGDKFKTAGLLPVEIAQLRAARFEEGDTAGWEKWMKTQPQSVQDDWQANKEKYRDKFKTAAKRLDKPGKKASLVEYKPDGTGRLVWGD